ncbi:MAG: NAD-dependent epimerase/dehydratase family protein, partial [Silvanigrellaceae bacterium]|nr:NAD-dependent epimerase/dehydratase family protein [Silvanigrellaceae bacterium]
MKILITGATGFIGSHLAKTLIQLGHKLILLVRSPQKLTELNFPGCEVFSWQGNELVAKEAFIDTEVFIHLAGESVFDKKWTSENKLSLKNS